MLLQHVAALTLVRALRERPLHLHADMAHAPATVGWLAATLLDIPFSFTGHANDLFERRAALRAKLADAAFVVCISTFHRDLYLREGAPPDRLHVLHLGTDVERFALVEPGDPSPPRILAAGRLVPKKGFPVLVDACALLAERGREFRAVIAGSGPQLDALRARVRERGVADRVEIPGEPVLQDALPGFLGGGSVFCLPCVRDPAGDMDGLPLVLAEAMASGLPVVSTRLAGVPDLVRSEQTGLLVEPGDPRALADALDRLLRDDALRRRLAAAGRAFVRAHFDERWFLDALAERIRAAAPSAVHLKRSPEASDLRDDPR
jgi:glycosyltransferase involved in cell wall biosynthesis